MSTEELKGFTSWAILEVMGHRRLGGYVQEQVIAGHGFLRIDVPGDETANASTQFYAPGSVYCLTPTTEETARAVAKLGRAEPVARWELPQPRSRRVDDDGDELMDDDRIP